MAAQGRDIKLSPARVETERNFATKLWNATRFAEMNGCARAPNFDPKSAKEVLNRWIAHETARTAREVTAALEAYRFNEAAGAVRAFVWNVFCDWYLELAKPVLTGPDGAAKAETQAMVAWARDEILKLLHPFMPFITEELWAVTATPLVIPGRATGANPESSDNNKAGSPVLNSGSGAACHSGMTGRDSLLALASWPQLDGLDDPEAEAEIGWVVDLVTALRSVRAEMNVTPATLVPIVLAGVPRETQDRAMRWAEFIKRLARVSDIASAARAKSPHLRKESWTRSSHRREAGMALLRWRRKSPAGVHSPSSRIPTRARRR
jgi:valyl-tRNA synthetase